MESLSCRPLALGLKWSAVSWASHGHSPQSLSHLGTADDHHEGSYDATATTAVIHALRAHRMPIVGPNDDHVAVHSATWRISGSALSAIFAALRMPMTARAKSYAAARGSITPIRIASGPFAASTAPVITQWRLACGVAGRAAARPSGADQNDSM